MKRASILVPSPEDQQRAATIAEQLRSHGTATIRILSAAEVTPFSLGETDVLISGDGGDIGQAAGLLERWVQAGGSLVAFAGAVAFDSASGAAGYREMLGTRCTGASPVTRFNVNVSDPSHEITRGLGDCQVTDRF